MSSMYSIVYLPTKLAHKNGVNVGIHIPAPWSIWDMKQSHLQLANFR